MKLASLLICSVIYALAVKWLGKSIRRLGMAKDVAPARIRYLTKTGNIALFIGFVVTACLILGLGYSEVSLFLSSVFAVIGVAMFAQWSILSNITASMVIFYGFPYRVGDSIKICDSDFDLSGTVEEISLFHVLIRTGQGNLITYPNNLILQKPVFKLDRGNTRFPGKAPASAPTKPAATFHRSERVRRSDSARAGRIR